MDANIVLNDAHIRGLITGAVEHEHAAASAVSMASAGGVFRKIKPSDKPTPSRISYNALETLWHPVLTQIYAMPAAQQLKGVIPDPQMGVHRIPMPVIKPIGGA